MISIITSNGYLRIVFSGDALLTSEIFTQNSGSASGGDVASADDEELVSVTKQAVKGCLYSIMAQHWIKSFD